MMGSLFGSLPLGFAQPLVLLGLLSLPVLWWLLRLVPPRPRRINFPPTRLLFEIAPKEETPSRTPWWLILLRLTLAALVIIAAAGPLWNPPIAIVEPGRAAPGHARRRLGRGGLLGCPPAHGRRTARARRGRQSRRRRAAAVGNRARSFAAGRRRRARADQAAQAEALYRRPHRGAAFDRALSQIRAGRRDRLALGRRRSRQGRRIHRGLEAHRRQSSAHRGRGRPSRPARARRRRQRGRRADGEGAARANRRRRHRLCERHRSQRPAARRGAVRVPIRRARKPTRRSICRSKSATTWRGWRSPASARPARCNCSTSAGAGAPSASCPARPPTARSR